MVVVVVGLSLQWMDSGTAYGLTEALMRSEKAEVVHVQGWLYQRPAEGAAFVKTPFEYWMDRRNGRYKSARSIGFLDSDPNRPGQYLRVFDGEYVMKTGYLTDCATGETVQRATYLKPGPFQRRIEVRTMAAFPEFVQHVSEVKGFGKVGRERIKGRPTDVWEGEIKGPGETVPYKKLRVWLCPGTGEILRLVQWSNQAKDSVKWVLRRESHTIEYNVTPPAGCFSTEAPAGHVLANTKETAEDVIFGGDVLYSGRSTFYGCIGFALPDGTVVYGWHANPEPAVSQAPLFADAVAGGPLPKLPACVTALQPWPLEEVITLEGRHLAWTQRGEKCYAWGIYVGDAQMPKRETFQSYRVVREYNGIEERCFSSYPNLIWPELTIESAEEFDEWVIGAMAELSDDGKAPAYVTYEGVVRLAGEIRRSLAR